MGNTNDIRIFNSIEEFEQKSAEEIAHTMQAAIRDRGVCHVVLSGGDTPKGIYRRLGTDPLERLVDWSRVHVFFSDERCVSPDDPQSNYGMVRRELTSHIGIAPQNVHRIQAESNPERAASEYEGIVRTVLGSGELRFDLILLGIGSDGHTASLFPSTEALHEKERWVRAVYVPRLSNWRVTLTFPAINSGREVFVFASGESKSAIVEQALTVKAPTKDIPVTLVHPGDGTLRWRVEKQAASKLTSLKSP